METDGKQELISKSMEKLLYKNKEGRIGQNDLYRFSIALGEIEKIKDSVSLADLSNKLDVFDWQVRKSARLNLS